MTGSDRARTVEPPPRVPGLAGLDRYDYAEAFAFGAAATRTPEEWSRRILLGASVRDRLTMLAAWTVLTVHLSPPWTPQILGWRILHSSPDALVLGVRATIGLTARIVIVPDEAGTVVHAMLVRFDRPLGRRVWQRMAPGHRKFLGRIISQAAR